MTARTRTILGASDYSLEYELGSIAAQRGEAGKSVPYTHGSKEAQRWVYGHCDTVTAMRREARLTAKGV
jgi:hypothetical protein